VAPAKFPAPGSHCSPTSTRALPQTGGTVIEAVPELDGVSEVVGVPVPVGVPETVAVRVQVPVAVTDRVQVPVDDQVEVHDEVHDEVHEEVHDDVHVEVIDVVGSGVSVGEGALEVEAWPSVRATRVERMTNKANDRIVYENLGEILVLSRWKENGNWSL